MDFLEIANARQSCRSYDETRAVEQEKLEKVLEAVRLSPSACNGQPYTITVCTREKAKEVALLTRGMGGMNKFAVQAPVCIVISEAPYNRTAALGAKVKGNDYRSIDIGIMTAYLTAEATAQGRGSSSTRSAPLSTAARARACRRTRAKSPRCTNSPLITQIMAVSSPS